MRVCSARLRCDSPQFQTTSVRQFYGAGTGTVRACCLADSTLESVAATGWVFKKPIAGAAESDSRSSHSPTLVHRLVRH